MKKFLAIFRARNRDRAIVKAPEDILQTMLQCQIAVARQVEEDGTRADETEGHMRLELEKRHDGQVRGGSAPAHSCLTRR